MDLEKSIELFKISDLTSETKATLKAKYRKLMIKYHPDNCNGKDDKAKEVSLAYDILKDALDQISKYKAINEAQHHEEYTIIIPLSKLIELYRGKTITLGSGSNTKGITKKDIQRYNTLIISDVTIEHNGIIQRFSNIQHWSISDNYAIQCEVTVNNLSDKETIRIRLEDFDREISFMSQAASIRVPLSFNITVEIKIDKKLVTSETEKENN